MRSTDQHVWEAKHVYEKYQALVGGKLVEKDRKVTPVKHACAKCGKVVSGTPPGSDAKCDVLKSVK